MYSIKAASNEDDPAPISTRVVVSNVLFHLFFWHCGPVEIYKVI